MTNTTLTRPVRRQHWMTSQSRELALCLCDASGSMMGQKADDANRAFTELITILAEPYNKDGFYTGVIHFSETASITGPPVKASLMALNSGKGFTNTLPVGSTNITAGLDIADQIINQYGTSPPESNVHFLDPVVLLYTDGQHNHGPSPATVAANIKQRATLVTIAFGADADESHLKTLATSDQHFCRCNNGNELRAFLASVGDTLSKTRAVGKNARAELGQLTQQ